MEKGLNYSGLIKSTFLLGNHREMIACTQFSRRSVLAFDEPPRRTAINQRQRDEYEEWLLVTLSSENFNAGIIFNARVRYKARASWGHP